MKLVVATLDGVVIARPPPETTAQDLCLDAGYDYDAVREQVAARGYTPTFAVERKSAPRNRYIPKPGRGGGSSNGRIVG